MRKATTISKNFFLLLAENFSRSITALVKSNCPRLQGYLWFAFWPNHPLGKIMGTSFHIYHSIDWIPGEGKHQSSSCPLLVAKGEFTSKTIAWRSDFKCIKEESFFAEKVVPLLKSHFASMGWKSEIAKIESDLHLVFGVLDLRNRIIRDRRML